MKNKRKAFTLIEIVIALAMMTIVVLSIFLLNQNANKKSMDAYYEMVAFSLAREPIEIYRGYGYDDLLLIAEDYNCNPSELKAYYPIDEFKKTVYDPESDGIEYPVEAQRFERCVKLEIINDSDTTKPPLGIKIKVIVVPTGLSDAEKLMAKSNKFGIRLKNMVCLESTVMRNLKW